MNGIAVLISLAAVGVDYGWQPAADGQLEYIIQIEPSLLENLKNGDEIVSEILPEARGVRKFRIRVGNGPLPRIGRGPEAPGVGGMSAPVAGATGSGMMPPGGGFADDQEFQPNGLLNLPPPPPLLDDGLNSVLVRPGSGSAGGAGEVLPPGSATGGVFGGGQFGGGMTLDPPTASEFGATGAAEATNPASGATTPGGLVLPPGATAPASGGEFGVPPSGLVLPPGAAPENNDPVRPVRPPSDNSGRPNPIRIGESGILPPGSNEMVSLGPSGAELSPSDTTRADSTETGKPTISEDEAAKIQPPWRPLVLVSLGLFASLAANLYLGWVALGVYRRYRDVVAQLHRVQTALT